VSLLSSARSSFLECRRVTLYSQSSPAHSQASHGSFPSHWWAHLVEGRIRKWARRAHVLTFLLFSRQRSQACRVTNLRVIFSLHLGGSETRSRCSGRFITDFGSILDMVVVAVVKAGLGSETLSQAIVSVGTASAVFPIVGHLYQTEVLANHASDLMQLGRFRHSQDAWSLSANRKDKLVGFISDSPPANHRPLEAPRRRYLHRTSSGTLSFSLTVNNSGGEVALPGCWVGTRSPPAQIGHWHHNRFDQCLPGSDPLSCHVTERSLPRWTVGTGPVNSLGEIHSETLRRGVVSRTVYGAEASNLATSIRASPWALQLHVQKGTCVGKPYTCGNDKRISPDCRCSVCILFITYRGPA
jgi:hypothetical protein